MKTEKKYQVWGLFVQPYSTRPRWLKWNETDDYTTAIKLEKDMNSMPFGNAPLRSEIRITK